MEHTHSHPLAFWQSMGLATLDFPGFFPLRISHSQCWSGPFLKWINNYSPHIHHITTWFFHHITTIIHHIFTTYSPHIHQIFTTYSHIIHIFTTYSPELFTTMIFNGSIPGFRGSSKGVVQARTSRSSFGWWSRATPWSPGPPLWVLDRRYRSN